MTDRTDKAAVNLPGHQADSPGNDYLAPGRLRSTPDGWIAVGHPGDQPTPVMGGQAIRPTPGADLATVYGADGALASSILEHQGRARVQVLDQSAAANPGFLAQLGPRAPGGIGPQPPDHIAPNSPQPVQPRTGTGRPAVDRGDFIGGQLQAPPQGGPA